VRELAHRGAIWHSSEVRRTLIVSLLVGLTSDDSVIGCPSTPRCSTGSGVSRRPVRRALPG